MKMSRTIVMGFRNIGSAASKVEVFNGTLAGSLEWLILKLSENTIAKRFQISIGRNESDMMQAFETQKQTKADDSMAKVRAMLASLGDDDDDNDSQDDPDLAQPSASGGASLTDPLDVYEE